MKGKAKVLLAECKSCEVREDCVKGELDRLCPMMKNHKISIDKETYAKLETIGKAQNKTPDKVATELILERLNPDELLLDILEDPAKYLRELTEVKTKNERP